MVTMKMVIIWLMMVNIYIYIIIYIYWLVVSIYPTEKWWSEFVSWDQLGLWHSQLFLESHVIHSCSKPAIRYYTDLYCTSISEISVWQGDWNHSGSHALPMAAVVLPAASRASVRRRTSGLKRAISSAVAAVAATSPKSAIVMIEFILHHFNTFQYHYGQNIVSLQISTLRLEAYWNKFPQCRQRCRWLGRSHRWSNRNSELPACQELPGQYRTLRGTDSSNVLEKAWQTLEEHYVRVSMDD